MWDVLTSEAAVDAVRDILNGGEHDITLVAEELIDIALDLGSCYIYLDAHLHTYFLCAAPGSRDNISAIVARFPAASLGDRAKGGVAKRRSDKLAARGPKLEAESN